MPAAIGVLVSVMMCSGCGLDFREVDGTDGILWSGGTDEYIRCAYSISIKWTLGYSLKKGHDQGELSGLKVIIRDSDKWFNDVVGSEVEGLAHVDGDGECSLIEVGRDMTALTHELLERWWSGWHGNMTFSESKKSLSRPHPDMMEMWRIDYISGNEIKKECKIE